MSKNKTNENKVSNKGNYKTKDRTQRQENWGLESGARVLWRKTWGEDREETRDLRQMT